MPLKRIFPSQMTLAGLSWRFSPGRLLSSPTRNNRKIMPTVARKSKIPIASARRCPVRICYAKKETQDHESDQGWHPYALQPGPDEDCEEYYPAQNQD